MAGCVRDTADTVVTQTEKALPLCSSQSAEGSCRDNQQVHTHDRLTADGHARLETNKQVREWVGSLSAEAALS